MKKKRKMEEIRQTEGRKKRKLQERLKAEIYVTGFHIHNYSRLCRDYINTSTGSFTKANDCGKKKRRFSSVHALKTRLGLPTHI